jgi:hypothetical protein
MKEPWPLEPIPRARFIVISPTDVAAATVLVFDRCSRIKAIVEANTRLPGYYANQYATTRGPHIRATNPNKRKRGFR